MNKIKYIIVSNFIRILRIYAILCYGEATKENSELLYKILDGRMSNKGVSFICCPLCYVEDKEIYPLLAMQSYPAYKNPLLRCNRHGVKGWTEWRKIRRRQDV